MIEINNFENMFSLLNFDNKNKNVILVWVVKRNKDGHKDAIGQNKNRTIKSYHFQTREQFDQKQDEIIKLCKEFKCRAYICVNAKPMLNILFNLQGIVMENIKNQIHGGSVMHLKGMIDSAVMKAGTDGNKKWVVDVDSKDEKDLALAIKLIEDARTDIPFPIIETIPTAHGYHLITYPFDTRALQNTPFEIKKDGLTLLYAYLEN